MRNLTYNSAKTIAEGNLSNLTSIRHRSGRAGRFLDEHGFGWLLEVNDDEEPKPLLLAFYHF